MSPDRCPEDRLGASVSHEAAMRSSSSRSVTAWPQPMLTIAR